jgi:hypothetical protein
MRKTTVAQQTKELLKANKVKPVKPLTKQQEINLAADQYRLGNVSALELGKSLKLTDKQILFAEAYCSPDMFGDKIAAAGKAYDIDVTDKNQRHKASDLAGKLSKHIGVGKMISILLNVSGLNKEDVDAQLAFMIYQHDNLPVKLAASKLWYEMSGLAKNYSEITVKHQYDYTNLTDEELNTYIKLKEKTLLAREDNLLPGQSGIQDAEVVE